MMSSNERINFRFYHTNPKDMQALQGLKDIARTENCTLNTALINVVNRYLDSQRNDYAETLAVKIAEHLKGFYFSPVIQTDEIQMSEEALEDMLDTLDSF